MMLWGLHEYTARFFHKHDLQKWCVFFRKGFVHVMLRQDFEPDVMRMTPRLTLTWQMTIEWDVKQMCQSHYFSR